MKTRTKRLISAGLVTTLVIAALQFLPDTLPNTSRAEGEMDFTVSGDVVRGVLDDISELSTKYNYDKSAPRGTVTHPFIVLEIVPYLEFAEFGYLIGGCEPIAIETLDPQTLSNVYGTVGTMNTSDVYTFNGTLYFFDDEPEYAEWLSKKGVGTYNINESATWAPNDSVYGYYELVEEGGNFLYTAPKDTASGGDQGQSESDSNQGQEQNESDSTQEELVEENQGDIPYTASIYTASDGDQEPSASVSTQSEDNDNMPIALAEEDGEDDDLLVATIKRVPDGTGNMVWHTANELNIYYHQWQADQQTMAEIYHLYEGITFEDDYETAIKDSRLSVVGEKLYTKRPIDGSHPALSAADYSNILFAEYKNRENFLRYSVIPDYKSEEEIDNYSVLVKTITPAELNETPGWIDYADLISISPKQHSGGENYRVYWDEYNRLGKSRTNTTGNYVENFEDNRDISWEVALKLYYKVTADTDFAALAMDSTTWNVPNPKKSVTVDVYDFNLYKKITQPNTLNIEGSANNVFKLACMLICMDPYFFKQIYLNGDDPILQTGELVLADGSIKTTGKISIQEGDAAYYWLPESFLLAPNDADVKPIGNEDSLQAYWDKTMWDTYGFCSYSYAVADYPSKNWCKGHVYAYKGDHALSMGYTDMSINTVLERFTDFAGSLKEGDGPYTKEAIQYVLGIRSNPNDPTYGRNMTLKVLDIEPSVDLNEDETPKYYLQPTYFTMLLPNFRGDLHVTHQTTAEFIGKIEDLNSIYDMIYIGLDASGYNTDENGSTVWNDTSLNGKIYMRIGDFALGDKYHDGWGNLSVDWLLDKNSKTQIESNVVRFAGNDISVLKKNELVDYLNAGYPIVVDQWLYNCVVEHNADRQDCIIEKNTRLFDLIDQNNYRDNIIGTANTVPLEDAVKKALGDDIIFQDYPVLYDGTTKGVDSAEFENINCYLPRSTARDTLNQPYLSFGVIAAKSGYKYKIYVDINQDSRFDEENEILASGSLNEYLQVDAEGNIVNTGYNSLDRVVYLPEDWVGLLQWKIRVYLDGTGETVRYELTGCSAVDLNTSSAKQKEVSVLQIMPDDTGFQGALNLEESLLFRKYYEHLKDYDLSIKSITYSEYKGYFVDKGFEYDFTKTQSDNNPVNVNELDGNLLDYNMIIVGFGDCYAKTSITNEYGQLDFLRYFADQGKSILYTHDLTTFYNGVETDISFYPTSRLREVMGMNRYGSINFNYYYADDINDETRDYLLADSEKYDNNNTTDQIHGYTYFAIKRLGTNESTNANYKLPYKYISGDYLKDHFKDIPNGTNSTNTFNFMNEITTVASKVNEGQITVYPYKIDNSLKVAATHGQYYQLNPEDKNLTVWYCLAGDDHTSHGSGDGTSLTYAVSPNDTMNNYYIYSKENIFYSGVGHSTVASDMEAKLFVNTMIAAFNAAVEPPKVEVTNPEATLVGTLKYDIELMQLYDFDASGELVGVGDSSSSSDYTVTFKPRDYNLTSEPKLECAIQWENGDYVKEVWYGNERIVINDEYKDENGVYWFKGDKALKKDREYSLVYPAEYFSNYPWTNPATGESGNTIRTVSFTIKNDRLNKSNTTILDMSVQPLFPLD